MSKQFRTSGFIFFLILASMASTTSYAVADGKIDLINEFTHVLRIGIAKDIPTPAWRDTQMALQGLGYLRGQNLSVTPINLGNTNDPQQQQRVLAALDEVDIFFATGNVLPRLFPLTGLKTPVCFIAIKETADFPEAIAHLFIGIIRGSYASMLSMARSLSNRGERMGFIYRANSNIAQKTLKTIQQTAKVNRIKLDVKKIDSIDDIETALRELKKSSDYVLLFPPVVNDSDIGELVRWQNELKLPIFSQVRERIQAGLVGGMIIDREQAAPILASYIDKIARGTPPSDLPITYQKPKYVLNLKAVEQLGLKVSKRILRRAEIVNE